MRIIIKSIVFIVLSATVVAGARYAISKRLAGKQKNTAMDVTASFYPLADFAKKIGGDKVHVRSMVPSGIEPHEFDPSPRDLVTLSSSRVFIYNGLGLEPWVSRILSDVRAQGVIVVDGSSGIIINQEGSAQLDPHIWLDPVLARAQVENILNGFIVADPVNKEYYQIRAQNFLTILDNLDHAFQVGLATCKRNDVIVAHDAFGYLAKRYHINVVSVLGFSPEDEPSPQKLAQVAQFAKEHQVTYILFETLVSSKFSETIAHEIGAQTAVLNPIEGLTAKDEQVGNNYVTIQMENLSTLRQVLGCI